ncbi:hypothetical protein VD0002_g10093 [Verticillium dahliae]|uniref:Protein ECM13 n=2 Tax=Verticillium dahliae TaxID=27337 RepID=G2XHS1_VERDV|nr:uncharacterized protein VDAG_09825 [Verticillium dahliae VdLs.17]KAF3344241.1 Reticuline oxidase [Verticillium dahliae VDG2]KAH6704493.1 hypothetical protein EV126DRAFT_336315 [Verticillium dahliae]EGY19365.1 hypothetical protein VDAG_09825 [Verticillium dahliae VdLs.17]PNH27805.1 hypothetical protein BJF96_g8943 [Verticillium dahliae]PNH39256.1 hypothetical protein VD0004_g7616 [Verticillium dahliae]
MNRPPHSPFNTHTTKQTSLRKTMSITQTYYLAHKARAKLSTEAARADHDLRLLVGHANLLDSLMLDLADAEREQESWFNQSVRGAQEEKKDRHVQWADSIVEDPEEDWNADDASSTSSSDESESDSEDDYDSDEEDDIEMADVMSLRRISSTTKQIPILSVDEDEDDMEEDDLEEDYAQLELVRTSSHSNSPPDLAHDSDYSSDDDDAMPPSPPNTILTFSEKDAKQEPTSEQQQQQQDSLYSEGFYLPSRNPARLVSAISVY